MKILLINPPSISKELNIGLFYLATSLLKNNHVVQVLDLNKSYSLHNKLNEFKPDIIGFSIHALTYKITKELINNTNYNGYIIIGGPQAKLEKDTIFDEINNLNGIVIGEGEEILPKIISNFKDKSVYEADTIKYLDKLHYPDYKSFGINKFKEYPILTSRSCPYNCIFCYNHLGKLWRAHSPEYVVDELLTAKRFYNSNSFRIVDAVFNIDVERVKKICELIIKHKLNMKFLIDGFIANKIDNEMAAYLKKAGCYSVSIGVETLIDDIYQKLNKPHTIDDIKQCVSILRKYRIRVCGNFIIGLPNDNYKKSLENFNKAKELKFSVIMLQLLVPYPTTPVYEWMIKNTRVLNSYKEVDAAAFNNDVEVTFEEDNFKKEEKIKLFKEISIKNKIYPPKKSDQSYLIYAFYILKQVIKYDKWNIFSHLIKMGILMIRQWI